MELHGSDTEKQVFFYERDFYILSNFSAFTLQWFGYRFDTSEAAYHWTKFNDPSMTEIRDAILLAPSAHEAFKIAERFKDVRREDWDDVKVPYMKKILRAKADQHEYVKRKLLATGDRELIENSWRDNFWGWGPNKDGKNMLGKLWMEIREEMRPKIMLCNEPKCLRECDHSKPHEETAICRRGGCCRGPGKLAYCIEVSA